MGNFGGESFRSTKYKTETKRTRYTKKDKKDKRADHQNCSVLYFVPQNLDLQSHHSFLIGEEISCEGFIARAVLI